MWELDHKEGWVPKNWCFQTVVLEKTLESSLDCKKIKLLDYKGNQPWMFIGRTDAEAEAEALATHWKSPWCLERQKEKEVTEGEMPGWHHRLDEHGFEQTLEDSERQEGLGCCSPWGHKESYITEQLTSNNINTYFSCVYVFNKWIKGWGVDRWKGILNIFVFDFLWWLQSLLK